MMAQLLTEPRASSSPLPLAAKTSAMSVTWSGGPSYGIKAFTGREWDPEINLCYYRARYYDPKVGRFISEDPIGFGGGMNLYGYVENNPVNEDDPLGLRGRGTTPWGPRPQPTPTPGLYDRFADLRREGHQDYPGEGLSDIRHCVMSCKAASTEGEGMTRLMGYLNEIQGLLWHDIWDLPGRLSGDRPWAFSPDDIRANEKGIQCARKGAVPGSRSPRGPSGQTPTIGSPTAPTGPTTCLAACLAGRN